MGERERERVRQRERNKESEAARIKDRCDVMWMTIEGAKNATRGGNTI